MAAIPIANKNSSGVLLGRVNDIYSVICSEMTNEPFSIVGVYYTDNNGTMTALIYRIFDGTIYPFLTHEINFERLSTHQLVESMYIYEFNQEGWVLDGNRDLLTNRLKAVISRCVIQNISTPDYKKIIMNTFGIQASTVVNGYYRINEMLLAITNDDPSKRKSSLHRNIVDCKYLTEGRNIVKGYHKEYNDPSREAVISDSQKRLVDLAQATITLICENTAYRNYLIRSNGFKPNLPMVPVMPVGPIKPTSPVMSTMPVSPINIIDDESDELSSRTSEPFIVNVPAEIGEELLQLKGIINEMIVSFNTKSNPVISIVDLIDVYNKLADKGNVARIETNHSIKYNSVGALLISGSDGLRSNEVRIELRSGDVLYIPCTGEGIDQLSDDEKLEVLRYVLSLRKATNSYNGLLDIIVEECAGKTKRNYPI